MADKNIVWNTAQGVGDYAVANGDMGYGNDLLTSVIISLFTNRRLPDEVKRHDDYRGGWWGDAYSTRLIGSRLWLLNRAKKTDSTSLLVQAKDYCNEALQWLIDDGVVKTIETDTHWLTDNAMEIDVGLTEPQATVKNQFRFAWAWDHLSVPQISSITTAAIYTGSESYSSKLGSFILGKSRLTRPATNPAPLGSFILGQNTLGSI